MQQATWLCSVRNISFIWYTTDRLPKIGLHDLKIFLSKYSRLNVCSGWFHDVNIRVLPGVRRSGESMGLEIIHHHLREQRGSGASAGVTEGTRTLRTSHCRSTTGRRLWLQVSNVSFLNYTQLFLNIIEYWSTSTQRKTVRNFHSKVEKVCKT